MPRLSRALLVAVLVSLRPWPEAAAQVLDLESVMEVGVLDGAECATLGRISSGAIGADQRIFVVDELARVVRVFDQNGQCLPTIGRVGQGPGEFQEPRRVRIYGDVLHIMDIANLRVERLRVGDSVAERLDEIPLRLPTDDFCVMDGEVYTLAYSEGRAIQVIDEAGSPIRSFASVENQEHPMFASVAATGYLHCDDSQKRIVHAEFYRPSITAYNPDGSVEWTTSIPGYAQTTITPLPNGGVRYSDPEPGNRSDVTVALASLNDEYLLVQIGKIVDLRVFDTLRTLQVEKATGAVRPLQSELPVVLDRREDYVLTASTDEFPRASLWRFRRR